MLTAHLPHLVREVCGKIPGSAADGARDGISGRGFLDGTGVAQHFFWFKLVPGK